MMIYNQVIGMEFDTEKCSIPIIKNNREREITEQIEQPNQERIKTL